MFFASIYELIVVSVLFDRRPGRDGGAFNAMPLERLRPTRRAARRWPHRDSEHGTSQYNAGPDGFFGCLGFFGSLRCRSRLPMANSS